MRAWVIVALVGGCVSSDTTLCDGDARCPAGTECVAITYTDKVETTCVQHDQRVSCAALDDGTECMVGIAKGTCHEQVCFADRCGNRLVDSLEVCDDGNTIADDGCSATCVSNETCGNGVIDVVNRETCDDDEARSYDGCSSRCATESPTWLRLENARPKVRSWAGLVYDVARRRVVLFGGLSGAAALGDTGEWDGRRWSHPIALPEPLPRYEHAMAYDAAHGQIVMFGGDSAREMWLRDAEGAWSLIAPSLRPPVLSGASMVYDAGRQRVVLFGGYSTTTSNATWLWNGTKWSELTTLPRPPARSSAAMAYDPKRGVVVLTGGLDPVGNAHDDVWELDGDTWVERTPAAGRPAPRIFAAMGWEPLSDRVVLVGGLVANLATKDTWAWDGQTWTRLPADANAIAPDTGLARHAMTTDTARDRLVLVGTHGDVQEWNGTQWTIVDQLSPTEPVMAPRSLHVAALDPLHREVVVFGGMQVDLQFPFGDTWIWNGTWRQAIGPSPTPRYGATMVFDAARSEIVMFGGCRGGVPVSETWVWKAGSWTQKFSASSPPARCFHASAYDGGRKQVVVFGGNDSGGGLLADTWTWNGTTWTDEATGFLPEPRRSAAMAYDPVRDRVVLFGGDSNVIFGDTWTWDGDAWTKAEPESSPAPRSLAPIAWDAARQRIVVFAGSAIGNTSADVWEWDGVDWALIPTAGPPISRSRHTLVPDLDGAGVLVIGGYQFSSVPSGPLGDVWRLRWDDRGVQELCTDEDTDGDALIGAADPDCWSTLTPLCPPGTSCDPMAPRCGDLACNVELESCASCPMDCGACAAGCGDFACGPGETMASCPGDCGA